MQIQEEEEGEEEEEEPIDPQDVAKEMCAEIPACAKLRAVMDECNERVEGKKLTTETCTQELFDFLHCADHCVRLHCYRQLGMNLKG